MNSKSGIKLTHETQEIMFTALHSSVFGKVRELVGEILYTFAWLYMVYLVLWAKKFVHCWKGWHMYIYNKKTTENNESWVLSVQWAGQNKVVSRTKPQIQQTMQVRGMFLI